ncbi:MAG: ester cyclase [Actinomycetota bacterium]|nr:ester cyclase [Actinomycetota bacterium]
MSATNPTDSSEAEVRDLVERFTDQAWNKGDLDLIDELFAEDYVGHDAPRPEPVRGPEGMKDFLRMYHRAFSDAEITLDDVIISGDRVVTRWTGRGTHDGDLMGIPASGKAVAFTGIRIFRVADGKIAEGWVVWDTFGLMRQIGQS